MKVLVENMKYFVENWYMEQGDLYLKLRKTDQAKITIHGHITFNYLISDDDINNIHSIHP